MLKERFLNSKKDTDDFAREVASNLKVGDVLALYGELGSGKTYFTQQLCKFLDVKENVSSPSYVLMNEYSGKYPIRHLDLYRLDTQDDVMELGLYELFDDAVTIIEWAELAREFLPENTIHIHFEFVGKARKVVINK